MNDRKYENAMLYVECVELMNRIIQNNSTFGNIAGLKFKLGLNFCVGQSSILDECLVKQDATHALFSLLYNKIKAAQKAFKDDKDSFTETIYDIYNELYQKFSLHILFRMDGGKPVLPEVISSSEYLSKKVAYDENDMNMASVKLSCINIYDGEYREFVNRVFAYIKAKEDQNKRFLVGFYGADSYMIRSTKQELLWFNKRGVRINNLELKLRNIRRDTKENKDKERYITNYDLCHGKINILFFFEKFDTVQHEEKIMLIPNGNFEYALRGDARNIMGDISNIKGVIHPELSGDVSGLVGDITNLTGCATGKNVVLNKKLNVPTNIDSLLENHLDKEFKLLSNQDNIILMKVWNTLAHHTIGVTESERNLFDNPVKVKPMFPVDKWGRYYTRYNDDYIVVYSVNPADIMLAKDVNKCSTCFCLNSGTGHWDLGMRCLISLNCINPNLGVAFLIKKDSIKTLNQFNGIKFKWYDPEDASFFQYDSKDIYFWYDARIFNKFTDNWFPDDAKLIYGHDGRNKGHDRQKELAYLETFIKDAYRWNKDDKDFPLTTNGRDYTMEDVKKEHPEWEEQIELANRKAKELKEYLEQQKEQ